MNLRKPKRAEQVARRLEDRILAEAWPVGHPLGRESDLAAEAGVSRWTFREAIGLLEQDGLIFSRRGGGGGLFVAAPMLDVVANGLGNYLAFIRVEPSEVVGLQQALEDAVIERAAPRLDQAARESIGHLADLSRAASRSDAFLRTYDIRTRLLEIANQPALTLLVRALSRLAADATAHSTLDDQAYDRLLDEIVASCRGMAEALRDGDVERAHASNRAYIRACGDFLAASFSAGQLPSRPGAVERAYRNHPEIKPAKKPERLAWQIRELIIARGWPIGWNIGTEAELTARFGVGRPVLREAIRSLERLGVAEMGRGGASGLTVISPDPARIVAACRRHLRRTGVTSDQAEQVRRLVSQTRFAEGRLARLIIEILAPPPA